jgi:hypothetical protein
MKTLKEITKGIAIAYTIIISIVLFATLIGSCTPQKRLDRLVKKHPHLSRIDTVNVVDTVTVMLPGVRADTNMTKPTFLSALKDTIILQKEQLTVKIYEYRDSVFIEGSCDTVYKTVVREVKVPYPTITPNPATHTDKFSWFERLILVLILVLLLKTVFSIRK